MHTHLNPVNNVAEIEFPQRAENRNGKVQKENCQQSTISVTNERMKLKSCCERNKVIHCQCKKCHCLQCQASPNFTLDQICAYKEKCVYAQSSNVSIFHSIPWKWMNEWSNPSNSVRFECVVSYCCMCAYTNFNSPNHIFCCDSQRRILPHIVHYSILSSLFI